MDLERLHIEVRPRSHFQALDLGVLMARRWYAPLLLLGGVPLLLVAVLVSLLLHEHPAWIALIVWWCKPACERLPLRYLSRAIFEGRVTPASVLSEWRSTVPPGLHGALTWRRLSPRRSFEAPVWVLERLSGTVLAQRRRVLGGRAGSAALWLTVIGIHIESFLALALITTAWMFVPGGEPSQLVSMIGQETEWQVWLSTLAGVVCIAAVMPFYVACGFSLYLNRRAELEAWDLEIAFRRLARRFVTAAALCTMLVVLPDGAWAEAASQAESRAVIVEVLDDETFTTMRTVRYPAFLADWFAADDAEEVESRAWDGVFAVLAQFGEVLLWIGVGALVVWILARLNRMDWTAPGAGRSRRTTLPGELFGMRLDEETLPDDVIDAARARWRADDPRGALSLLLRAALAEMVHAHGCRFRSGDTEGDCQAEVARNAPPDVQVRFGRLIEQWRLVAYAHRPVASDEFYRVCDDWSALRQGSGS